MLSYPVILKSAIKLLLFCDDYSVVNSYADNTRGKLFEHCCWAILMVASPTMLQCNNIALKVKSALGAGQILFSEDLWKT